MTPITDARPRRRRCRTRRRCALSSTTATCAPLLITVHPARRRSSSFGFLESWYAHGAGDRHRHRRRAGARPRHLRQLAAPGQRLHHRHQRRHPGPLAVLLAVLPVRSLISITSKYVLRVERPAPLEPVELRRQRRCCSWRPTRCRCLSVQWGNAVAPMVVIWLLGLGDRLARRPLPHQRPPTSRRSCSFSRRAQRRHRHPWLANVAPITGPMYQLFIFFMITDPKTTVRPSGRSASWCSWSRSSRCCCG